MAANFTVLSGRLTLDTAPWQNALRQAQPALAQFVRNMGQTLDSLKTGTRNVAAALGGVAPALTGLVAAGSKLGTSFEQSFAGMREMVRAATGDFKALEEQAGRSWPVASPAVLPAADQAATFTTAGAVGAGVSSSQVPPPATSALGGPASGATLLAYGTAIMAQFQLAGEMEVKLRETALSGAQQLQQAFQNLIAAVKLGDAGLGDLQVAAAVAAQKAKQLGIDMDELDQVQRKNTFHAAGKLTPEEDAQQLAQA
ncbi:MAG TPA: hypothetical protein VGX76_15195 [Pirellulales bacterium]|jgi:hypothetical protein|nr:hypothetical protein [Pirellulales bacterium]